MKPLKIILCQFDITWENAQANRDYLSQLFSMIPADSADLIILPEMFTTGFSMNSAQLAESMDGPTIQWLKKQADLLQTAISGSLIIEENNQYFNRLVWIEPGCQKLPFYDKKHLFSLAGEEKHYKAGKDPLHVQWKGWNIAFYICYDLRFPVWTRNTRNTDLMIYVANFPAKREKAWNRLLPARAIENQCYVAAVNRIGLDGNGIDHQGDSAVYNYEGDKISDQINLEQLSSIELDYQALQVYKRAYPFLNDRDRFQIINQ